MISSIPEEVRVALQSSFGTLNKFSPAHGGCINNGGRLKTSTGELFIKWNSSMKYPDMFKAEAHGLNYLAATGCVRVPRVRAVLETKQHQVLVLEVIVENRKSPNYWSSLGRGLASIHGQSNATFGLESDNYIGSLPQKNSASGSLIEFYVDNRFRPQLELASRSGLLVMQDVSNLENLFVRLNEILPERAPSLLHGDLWSGNIMSDDVGEPVLIDPAVYYGAPEADIAMTRLFGGFHEQFYEAYFAETPMDPGVEERILIYQLYPLLVHVNLFGRSYVSQVREILSRFT